jgi:hypothetical protein
LLVAPVGNAIKLAVHEAPFHASSNNFGPSFLWKSPTATQAADELHDTPVRAPSTGPWAPRGVGVGLMVQADPFHDSASGNTEPYELLV